MTPFQERQAFGIRQELLQRKAKYVAEYGERFLDVIVASPNKHGEGRVGYATMFGNRQTGAGGHTIQEFAKSVFGAGVLKYLNASFVVVLKPVE